MTDILSPTPSENDTIFPEYMSSESNCRFDLIFIILPITAVLLFAGLFTTLFVVFVHISDEKHSECSYGYETFSNSAYCYKVFSEPLNVQDALDLCYLFNGTLAYVTSEEENQFLSELYKKSSLAKSMDFLIGVIYADKQWRTLDGMTISYTNWDNGMPVDKERNRVVVVQTGSPQYKWKNIDCFTKLPFICQQLKKGNGLSMFTMYENMNLTSYFPEC